MEKKERMERLIASIDRILKGDNAMDFKVFSKTELEDVYNSMARNMSEKQKAILLNITVAWKNGRKNFLKMRPMKLSRKNFEKIVEWYGSKEKALEASKAPGNTELVPVFQKRLQEVIKKLAEKKGQDVNSFEVKELVGEYDSVAKQMYQLPDVTSMMLEIAVAYRTNREIQTVQDSVYGEGTTKFIGQAMEAFYQKK